MRSLTIPRTELTVSVLCLGAGPFGTRTPREEAFAMLDLYVEQGGSFLDTAHIYAAWVPDGWGVSERTLGEWMRSRNARDRVVVGTKGAHPHLHSMQVSRMGRAEIQQDLEESLTRLQTDVVDLYWLHRDAVERPVGEIIETLEEFVTQGKIRYYGCSNWSPQRMQEAQAYAAENGRTGFVASQPGWNLAVRNFGPNDDPTVRFMDDEMYAFHLETGLAVAAYSSQANGFFTGPYGRDILPPTPGVRPNVVGSYYNETNFTRLDRARELAVQYGCSANDIALAYLTSQPFPTCAILGCGTVEHLQEGLTAQDLQLDPRDRDGLVGR